MRILVLLALVALAILGARPALAASFIDELVPNEQGFEGAVEVVDAVVDGEYGVVTVRVPYLNMEGQSAAGLARMIVHQSAIASGAPLPAFCHVHYEKDADGAKFWADRGWAVFTSHYDEAHPIDVSTGHSYNQTLATLQWVRRLPFIDRTRLHIDGGSQGGYMALAMASEIFPVAATTADCPVVNWAYNFAYFEANRAISGAPNPDPKACPLPIMAGVLFLGDMTYTHFGDDLSDETWYHVSPLSYLDRISGPVLVTAATGDMLVPHEQFTRRYPRPVDPERFPEGYTRDFDAVTACAPARKTIEEALPADRLAIQVVPLPEEAQEISIANLTGDEPMPDSPPYLDRPWSKDHQWTLLLIDEGPAAPQAGHFTHRWDTLPLAFTDHYRTAPPSPDILNPGKLDRLMQRYAGELEDRARLKSGAPAMRRNFAALDRLDVLTGLLDYAELGADHAARLTELYAAGRRTPFGPELDLAALRALRQELIEALHP